MKTAENNLCNRVRATQEFGSHKERILVLQCGGSLGADQAGVYDGLAEVGFAPNWVAGASIGVFKAALIVGNTPEHRVEWVQAFSDLVTRTSVPFALPPVAENWSAWMNHMNPISVATSGVERFFNWPGSGHHGNAQERRQR